jgi:hypothetical protein
VKNKVECVEKNGVCNWPNAKSHGAGSFCDEGTKDMSRALGLIGFTIFAATLAMLTTRIPAFAQAGSTGGTIGKTNKSISGGEEQSAPVGRPREEAPRRPQYKWRYVRAGDCGGQDIQCSAGPEPKNAECNESRLGLTSVCFNGNHQYPAFTACQGREVWCTYKSVRQSTCVGGGNPGSLYECVKE